jgi:hypothetical protein
VVVAPERPCLVLVALSKTFQYFGKATVHGFASLTICLRKKEKASLGISPFSPAHPLFLPKGLFVRCYDIGVWETVIGVVVSRRF